MRQLHGSNDIDLGHDEFALSAERSPHP